MPSLICHHGSSLPVTTLMNHAVQPFLFWYFSRAVHVLPVPHSASIALRSALSSVITSTFAMRAAMQSSMVSTSDNPAPSESALEYLAVASDSTPSGGNANSTGTPNSRTPSSMSDSRVFRSSHSLPLSSLHTPADSATTFGIMTSVIPSSTARTPSTMSGTLR